MPKYLSRTSYTAEGLKRLLKDGGTKRKQEMERFAESLGGKLEAFYYAFGDDDRNLSTTFGHSLLKITVAVFCLPIPLLGD